MNKHNNKSKKHKPNSINQLTEIFASPNGVDLDQLANELDILTRKILRDEILRGPLAGREGEIRQDAILLALRWFVKPKDELEWIAPRAIAHALRIVKMRHASSLSKKDKKLISLTGMNGGFVRHASDIQVHELPQPAIRELVDQAISAAVKSKRISQSNGCIAGLVLLDGMPVSQVAKRLGVHRSAVYQQLQRVRRALPAIIDTMEVPTCA